MFSLHFDLEQMFRFFEDVRIVVMIGPITTCCLLLRASVVNKKKHQEPQDSRFKIHTLQDTNST